MPIQARVRSAAPYLLVQPREGQVGGRGTEPATEQMMCAASMAGAALEALPSERR